MQDPVIRKVYLPFLWHGFFLYLTMSMIEFNTVLPNLVSELTSSPVAFGGIYSILLGAPLIFNILFSNYMRHFAAKRKFLLLGIYVRSLSFLGMAASLYFFASSKPILTLLMFYALILLFSLSGGFASIAYSDLVGKLLPSDKRPGLFANRQLVGSVASLIGGALVARVFTPGRFSYPGNYVLLLVIGFVGLAIGAQGFWKLEEPVESVSPGANIGQSGLIKDTVGILKRDKAFRSFILLENVTSFSLMIMPFYMLYVKQSFANYADYFGTFVFAQLAGNLLSNFAWIGIAKKFGTTAVLRVCILTGAIIPLLALALYPAGASWYVLVFLLVGMITSGRNIGFEPYLLDIAPEDQRTMYLGIRGTLNILVVLLPIAGGSVIHWLGYPVAFVLVSSMMLSSLFLLRKARQPQ